MKSAAILILVGVTVALGIYLGWRVLRRQRNRPGLGALHLLLGAAGLESVVMLQRGAPDGTVVPAAFYGSAAALLLAFALISGLVAAIFGSMWGRRPANVALCVHATVGALGFAGVVAWLVKI